MMLGDKLGQLVQQALEESRRHPTEDSPEKLPERPVTGRTRTLFLPIAVFLALLVIGSTVISQSLTAHGSRANVIAEMLRFVFELVFLAYMLLLGTGFGIGQIVEAIRNH
jgi:hypothetical protein